MDIEDLILSGALEPVGIDSETGEILYNFTDKLLDVHPVLHKEINNLFSRHIMELWQLDMVSMNIMEDNPIVTLTEKAFNQDAIKDLDEEVLHTLKELKRHIVRR